jgi:hypothetical protein
MWASNGGPESSGVKAVLASFAIPLAEAPTANVVAPGQGEGEEHEAELPVGCKGNFRKPEANAGNLCVFEIAAANVEFLEVQPSLVGTTGALGIVNLSNSEEPFKVFGTWAVTAK